MASITKKNGQFQAIVRRVGHPSASKSFPTRAEAAKWARDVEARMQGGGFERASKVTVADLLATYEAKRAAASRNRGSVMRMLREHFGKKRLGDVSRVAVLSFAEQRKAGGASPATISMDLSYLATGLRVGGAYHEGIDRQVEAALAAIATARHVLRDSGTVGRPVERDRRPTEDELIRLLVHWSANARQMIPVGDIVLFACASAFRLSEITGLRWSDLDEDKRTILIRDRKDPRRKAGNHQRVPLLAGPMTLKGNVIDPLAIILRQPGAARRDGRIFDHNAQSVSTAFARAVEALEIDDLHFHDLRHEGVSRLFEAGLAIQEVALISGHKTWTQLRRYTQTRPEGLVEKHSARTEVSQQGNITKLRHG